MQLTYHQMKAKTSRLKLPYCWASLLSIVVWWIFFKFPFPLHKTNASGLAEFQQTKEKNTERILKTLKELKDNLKNSSNPTTQLIRIGLLYFHLEEADSAAEAFKKSLKHDANLAIPHAGLGRIQLELKNNPRKALPHIRSAVAIDSANVEWQTLLVQAYIKIGETGTRARRVADRLIRMDPNQAPAYLLLANSYQEENNTKAATIFFQKYLELQPNDQGAAYKFTLSLLKNGDFQTVETLASRMKDLRGLPLLSQAQIHRKDHETALKTFQQYIVTLSQKEQNLYDDISLVALPKEIRAYQSMPLKARETFLRDFWLRKDPFKTSGGAMRRAEHYRRVWHAQTFFGNKTLGWDKRGDVYIRYGEPDYRSSSKSLNAQIPLAVQQVQESIAHRLYGDRGIQETFVGPVFPIRIQKEHGRGFDQTIIGPGILGLSGWKPVTSGSNWPTVHWETWIYVNIGKGLEVAFTDEFQSGNYDYAPIPILSNEDIERYRSLSERSYLQLIQRLIEFSPATRMANLASIEPEIYPLTDLEPLDFYYETLTFRGHNGKTQLQINLALPIDNVALPRDPDTVVVVERRTMLIHSHTKEVHKTMNFIGLPIRDRERNQGFQALNRIDQQIKPGEYELAIQTWRQNTDKMGVYRETITIPDYAKDHLMLSDIQIAHKITNASNVSNPRFVRGRWNIHPSPSAIFLPGIPLFVYFEIYNLTQNTFGATRYEVYYEIQMKNSDPNSTIPLLTKLRKKNGETIGVRFEQVGTEPSVFDYIELDLGDAKPGQYTLKMNIRDLNSGQQDSRKKKFKLPKFPSKKATRKQ